MKINQGYQPRISTEDNFPCTNIVTRYQIFITADLILLHFRVGDFEFTSECVVFDLLSIELYHGWLIDPQNTETVSAIGGLSYNQLVEKIIASKQDGAESQLVSEGIHFCLLF